MLNSRDIDHATRLDIKVYHKSHSKNRKKRNLIGTAYHTIGELVRRQARPGCGKCKLLFQQISYDRLFATRSGPTTKLSTPSETQSDNRWYPSTKFCHADHPAPTSPSTTSPTTFFVVCNSHCFNIRVTKRRWKRFRCLFLGCSSRLEPLISLVDTFTYSVHSITFNPRIQ